MNVRPLKAKVIFLYLLAIRVMEGNSAIDFTHLNVLVTIHVARYAL